MERRHLLVLPALFCVALPQASFRDECGEDGVDLQNFCPKCFNSECADSFGSQKPRLARLAVIRRLVEEQGFEVRYIHVKLSTFREIEREAGAAPGRYPRTNYRPWDDSSATLHAHPEYEEDLINLHAYSPGITARSRVGSGAKYNLTWDGLGDDYRIDISWDPERDFRFEDPVSV